MKSARVGLADLRVLLDYFGDRTQDPDTLSFLTSLVGLRQSEVRTPRDKGGSEKSSKPITTGTEGSSLSRPARRPTASFVRMTSRETFAKSTATGVDAEAEGLRETDLAPGKRPEMPPLVSSPRLRALLSSAVRVVRTTRQVNVVRAVRQMATLSVPCSPPRLRRSRFASEVLFITDRSNALVPIWEDQERVEATLRRLVGPLAVKTWTFCEGVRSGLVEKGALDPESSRGRMARLGSGSLALAVSDLGLYRGSAEALGWRDLGRRLRSFGVTTRSLVPMRIGGTPRWMCEEWDARALGDPGSSAVAVSGIDEHDLLVVLSPLVRIDPGLLRLCARFVGGGRSNLSSELSIWNGPGRAYQHALGLTLTRRARNKLGEEFSRRLNDERARDFRVLFDRVTEIRRSWREEENRFVVYSDIAGLHHADPTAVSDSEVEFMRDFASRIAGSMGVRDGQIEGLSSWLEREQDRTPQSRDPTTRGALARAIARTRVGSDGEEWELAQVGGHLVLSEGRDRTAGSLLGTILADRSAVRIDRAPFRISSAGGSKGPLPDRDDLVVTSGQQRVTLESWSPPTSLIEVGHDFDGLFTIIDDEDGPLRFRWHMPTLDRGMAYGEWRLDSGSFPRWAEAVGIDRFGAWATVQVDDVAFRFRWVPPGRYRMGSPGSEFGRYDDEVFSRISIDKGFWLGEFPVTRDLWSAVMKKEAAAFEKARHPIGAVSFEDCKEMLKRLGKMVPDLDPRLPWEAEWEYACRAGSRTASYEGNFSNETYPEVLDAIAWYEHNSGGASKEVGKKRPNDWGFYDMLGNINEWCEDPAEYDQTRDFVKVGAGSQRVIRGGGAWDVARYCRAAFRGAYEPSTHDDYLGFRLSRGPVSYRAEPVERSDSQGAEPQDPPSRSEESS